MKQVGTNRKSVFIKEIGEEVPALFIRAPHIVSVGRNELF